jgi:hypothetical protein
MLPTALREARFTSGAHVTARNDPFSERFFGKRASDRLIAIEERK